MTWGIEPMSGAPMITLANGHKYAISTYVPGFDLAFVGVMKDHMARGQKIGDLVAIMGTLDLVIPDIDR